MEVRETRKQVICSLMEDKAYVPMKAKEMAVLLRVAPEDKEEFQSILRELMSEGRLTRDADGKYRKAAGRVYTGTFISNAKGFGFVEVEGLEEDLYVPENLVHGAFHMDTVEAAPVVGGSGRRQEAQVIRVIARGISQVVGTYQRSRSNYGFVVPDNTRLSQDIFIPKEFSMGAVDGHKVVAEITGYGTDTASPEGRITEILGHVNDPGVDILSIVRGYELPMEFDAEVMAQAAKAPQKVTWAARRGRRDLRGVTMVTIDGEDAKDLDDAVSVSFDGKRYHLGVHIADVSNYVKEGTPLDRSALERGTSVYLVDRVIPMLPHALSNGICSLNEGEDRLALSCLMTIDLYGEVLEYEICESVIRVDRRMSYTAVKNILTDEAVLEREEYRGYAPLLPMFRQMEELSAALRQKRRLRGAIDFDFPESKIKLDREGHPTGIEPYDRNVATMMIEDFMLAANETVAEHFFWLELPFVYRVHDTPDAEKIEKLSAFINNFGYYMKSVGKVNGKVSGQEVHPKEIQKLLDKIAGTPEEAMISRLALRSMKQAMYSTKGTGHFGLACRYYCHFTSPIRRYPDLQIHRIIKEQLRGKLTKKRIEHYKSILQEVAKHSSDMERRADDAERDTDKLKKVEYMEEHLGEEFDGVVSGVTAWGIYVELPNTVEGLVHISKLPGDYYIYNESAYEMVGEHTGRSFKLGMPVRIRVEGTDMVNRTIDFSIAGENSEEETGGSGRHGRRRFGQAGGQVRGRKKKEETAARTPKKKPQKAKKVREAARTQETSKARVAKTQETPKEQEGGKKREPEKAQTARKPRTAKKGQGTKKGSESSKVQENGERVKTEQPKKSGRKRAGAAVTAETASQSPAGTEEVWAKKRKS